MKEVNQAIIETIAFFDMFQYPLTSTEVYKWLYSPSKTNVSFINIQKALKNLTEKKFLFVKNGQYVLDHQTHFIEIRQERYLIADKKYRKALNITKILTLFVPGILSVCVCNNLGYSNAKENSDIDLFIICKKNKLYQTRMMSVLILILLGKRPKKNVKKDKICLSFFLSEDHLNIESLKKGFPDIYLYYWIATLFPLYNKEKIYERFMKENEWVKNVLPHLMNVFPSHLRRVKIRGQIISSMISLFFPEKLCRKIQIKKFPALINEKMNKGSDVVINDEMIKLHVGDKRHYFYQKYTQKVKQLNNQYEKLFHKASKA